MYRACQHMRLAVYDFLKIDHAYISNICYLFKRVYLVKISDKTFAMWSITGVPCELIIENYLIHSPYLLAQLHFIIPNSTSFLSVIALSSLNIRQCSVIRSSLVNMLIWERQHITGRSQTNYLNTLLNLYTSHSNSIYVCRLEIHNHLHTG